MNKPTTLRTLVSDAALPAWVIKGAETGEILCKVKYGGLCNLCHVSMGSVRRVLIWWGSRNSIFHGERQLKLFPDEGHNYLVVSHLYAAKEHGLSQKRHEGPKRAGFSKRLWPAVSPGWTNPFGHVLMRIPMCMPHFWHGWSSIGQTSAKEAQGIHRGAEKCNTIVQAAPSSQHFLVGCFLFLFLPSKNSNQWPRSHVCRHAIPPPYWRREEGRKWRVKCVCSPTSPPPLGALHHPV